MARQPYQDNMASPAPLLESWFEDYEWPYPDPLDHLESPAGLESRQLSTASPVIVDDEDARTVSSSRGQTPATGGPPLLRLSEWDRRKKYDESPPTCIHYSIEWKLTVNGRVVSKDSEQDLVLAPSDFWDRTLRSKLDKLLKKKLPSNKSYKTDDTNIVVSVRDRSERDLVKRFDDLDIEWPIVET